MTLQQLKVLCEIAERNLNFSRTATALNTTQPAISRIIRSLEHELGTELLVRSGKSILRLTPQGEEAVVRARLVLLEIDNISRIGVEQENAHAGEMTVASTHTQASYGLVRAIQTFKTRYPNVMLHMRLGFPLEIAQWISKGEVDVGVNAQPEKLPDNIITLEAYQIQRCVIAPAGHPILKLKKPSARDIAQYPVVDYSSRARTGTLLRELFANAGVAPHIAITAADATAVVAYVEAGLGIAVVQAQVIEYLRDNRIGAIDASHLFPVSWTKILLRKDAYLRSFMYDFVELVAPQWTKDKVSSLMHGAFKMI